jgi:kynureninase
MKLSDIQHLDASDPLAAKRDEFDLPEQTIYLDGNSLGALPKTVTTRITEVLKQQWGKDLIKSWNSHNWIDLPLRVGDKIAPIVGAAKGQVICCDSISVNLFKVLSCALKLNPKRHLVLSTLDNFPTDLYMVQGLSDLLGQQACQLQMIEEKHIETVITDPELSQSVAILLLTQVNFRSGKLLDMAKITKLAQAQGILVIWDLAHSAGALPVQLDACQVDFAVGCGYKYLNGGPGAPAFLYVAQRHQNTVNQPLSGWMGHANPFAFDVKYQGAKDINQYLCGTPSILAMSAMDAALDLWSGLDIQLVRTKSILLAKVFMELFRQHQCLAVLQLCSPIDPQCRGSQLAFSHDSAYAICQVLIHKGLIADFRAPNLLRFGFTPLYTSFADIWDGINLLVEVMQEQSYLSDQYKVTAKVT